MNKKTTLIVGITALVLGVFLFHFASLKNPHTDAQERGRSKEQQSGVIGHIKEYAPSHLTPRQ